MLKMFKVGLIAMGLMASAHATCSSSNLQNQNNYNPVCANYDTSLMSQQMRNRTAYAFAGWLAVPKGPVAGSYNGWFSVVNNGDCTVTIQPNTAMTNTASFTISGTDYIGGIVIISKNIPGYSYGETEIPNLGITGQGWPVDPTVPGGGASDGFPYQAESVSKAQITAMCPGH